MIKQVQNRRNVLVQFNAEKIENAVRKAFASCNEEFDLHVITNVLDAIHNSGLETMKVEDIQDLIQTELMKTAHYQVAESFIAYRFRHAEKREFNARVNYIRKFSKSHESVATLSEVDANANVASRNIATIEAEVYKPTNKEIQRIFMKDKLEEMYPGQGLATWYIWALENHIIYTHDESSSPVPKPYCVAVSCYPFLLHGTSILDGLKADAPHNLTSFCGQLNNLIFLLSSQVKGAVAIGEFFNVMHYYLMQDFGEDYYLNDSDVVFKSKRKTKTIKDYIYQAFQNITYSINQPAGNRSYQSPFMNISYYDENYWHALFDNFVYPDDTKPEWDAIDYLQRLYMEWFNNERSKTLLTFPVETMAMLSDGKEDIIDKSYADFTAHMLAEGHSFFTYISDNPDGLSSCCRLRNQIDTNEFSFTSGLAGVATGSINVITLNFSRILQLLHRECLENNVKFTLELYRERLISILENVYKCHKAYRELLEENVDNGIMPIYTAGFISLKQQFSTIGLNGVNEAAMFLGMKCNDNPEYRAFCKMITTTLSEQNKKHTTKTCKFNSEFVPAEGLGVKNYNWDKEDGFWVPEGRNCYTSYFYLPDDPTISVMDTFELHGKDFTENLDGGVANHVNMTEHLSEKQYRNIIKWAVKKGCSYFTFNIPNSQCDKCGAIFKRPMKKCPHCGSEQLTWWTRIIGYLKPIKNFGKPREEEAGKRFYHNDGI